MVPAENKAKHLSSVNHTTETIHHHHHCKLSVYQFLKCSPSTRVLLRIFALLVSSFFFVLLFQWRYF